MTLRPAAMAALALVAALASAACGGGGGDDQAGGSTTSTRPAGPTTTAPAVVAGGDAPSSTTTTTRPPVTTTTRPAVTTTRPPPSTAATPTTPTAVQASPPGRFVYATTGSFTSPLGGTQRRDGETTLTVDPVGGGRQHSLRQGPGRSTDQTLELRPDGAYAAMVRITDSGFSQEIRPVPPVLAVPVPAPVGRSWSWKATTVDGRSTVDSSFRVTRRETLDIGGSSVTTSVVEATIATRGDIVSDGTQTFWYAEDRRLVVRQQERTSGRLGAITFTSESTDTLRSLQPG
ncbi:MAG: hypothetical protein ACRDZW_02690 [Acidimicrobiales bacterium]